jgi:hypothetical protein
MDTPLLISKFYSVADRSKTLNDLYLEFCSKVTEDKTPTISQFIYIFNMFDTDKTMHRLLKSIELNEEKLKEAQRCNDTYAIKTHTRLISSLQNQIFSNRQLVLKYSNDGLNRETPKKIISTTSNITPNDVFRLMNDSKKMIESKSEKVNDS